MNELYNLKETDVFQSMPLEEKISYFSKVAKKALPFWGCDQNTEIKLLNYTENATFKVCPEKQNAFIMRIHRAFYTNENSINSEFDWLASIRDDGIHVPTPIESINHKLVEKIAMPEYGDSRYVDCEIFEPGKAPIDIPEIEKFEQLGEIIAKVHLNAEKYEKPAYYERLIWEADQTFSKINNYHFEVYRENEVFTKVDIKILDLAAEKIKNRLALYGKDKHNYGLIHSDFRFSNILLNQGEFTILDFDDFGDGWYMYDIASVMALNEDRDDVDEIIETVLKGYQKYRKLNRDDLDMLKTFQMFRRMGMISVGMFFVKNAVLGAGENIENNSEQWKHYYKNTVEAAHRYLVA